MTDPKEEDRSLFYAAIHEKAVYTLHVYILPILSIFPKPPQTKREIT